MRIQEAGKIRSAAADEPERPVFTVMVGQSNDTSAPNPVDLDALRMIGWNLEPDPVVVSIAAPRLRRAGLVERTTGGRYRLTPNGVDLLDDDF